VVRPFTALLIPPQLISPPCRPHFTSYRANSRRHHPSSLDLAHLVHPHPPLPPLHFLPTGAIAGAVGTGEGSVSLPNSLFCAFFLPHLKLFNLTVSSQSSLDHSPISSLSPHHMALFPSPPTPSQPPLSPLPVPPAAEETSSPAPTTTPTTTPPPPIRTRTSSPDLRLHSAESGGSRTRLQRRRRRRKSVQRRSKCRGESGACLRR
jgi:hypothetical protein